jgi:hypothetical protein
MQHADPKKRKNRYDIPPSEREPAFQPVPEEKESRPELPELRTDKGEASPVVSEYGGLVSKYFNERRRIADLTDAGDTELFDHDAFLAEEQRSLEKLSNPETGARMEPKDVAVALGDLAGSMGSMNPELPGNATGEAETDKETERAYGETKKVFMESAKRVFPSVAVDEKNLGTDLKLTVERLTREVDPTARIGKDLAMPELKGEDIERMMESDPRGLASKIDTILAETGDLMQMRSRMNFNTGDAAERGELAEGARWLYKLQLIRDRLQERMYDGKMVTASAAKEIERLRSGLAGTGEGESAGTETERGMDDAAEQVLDTVEDAVAEERKLTEAFQKENKPFLPVRARAVEAMRSVWTKDRGLAERLRSLSAKVERMAEMKLAADLPIDRQFAYRASMRELFGELLPAEQRKLEAAAKKEGRHAEEFFAELMTVLVKRERNE